MKRFRVRLLEEAEGQLDQIARWARFKALHPSGWTNRETVLWGLFAP